jgi:A/G-specific adenine glycosylase
MKPAMKGYSNTRHSVEIISSKLAVELSRRLAVWFAAHQRKMPWRKTQDPYRIWVSEIMLQQTQVATVIPYFERFMKRFPDLDSLATADEQDVLKLWAGLGYYARARNLHRGAKMVVERFGGKVPDTLERIRQVPGIGEYTAGAILSIAFGKREALVDGNVARVLSRMFLFKGDWRQGAGKHAVWQAAREMLHGSAKSVHPGDLNQALMELGAIVCFPQTPDCSHCPIAMRCQAFDKGVQEQYPEIQRKARVEIWKLLAWLVEDETGRVILARRQAKGLFGGMWEVPMQRLTERLHKHSGGISMGRIRHVLSHRALEIEIRRIERGKFEALWPDIAHFPCWSGEYTASQWFSVAKALKGQRVGLPTVQKKILNTTTLENRQGAKGAKKGTGS